MFISAPDPPINSRLTLVSSQRTFEPILVYLVALQAFAHMVEVYNSGGSKPYPEDDPVQIGCKQASEDWIWAPRTTIQTVSLNITPTKLVLEKVVNDPAPPEARMNLGAIEPLMFSFGQALMINYFETYKAAIEDKFPGDPSKTWPPVWDFARIVRNAMSHRGQICFKNLSAGAVSWKGLSYRPANNGLVILHTDLWPGDLFDLIIEMDQHI